jgi:hypothetical protein
MHADGWAELHIVRQGSRSIIITGRYVGARSSIRVGYPARTDDFVVPCQNRSQAEEARTHVEALLAQLGLSLSPQKTAITSYKKGYSFLGFILSSRSRRIRPKSLEKFKDKSPRHYHQKTQSRS